MVWLERIPSILWAAYFFGTSAFFVTVATVVWLVTMPFDPNRRALHLFASCWAQFYFWTNPFWRERFIGRENIDPNKAYIIVSNHQSYWDILVLYGLFRPFKFVSKESIFKMPFIGWNMVMNEYVKLTRGDLKSIKEMMNTCKGWVKRGSSILLFPEGTRSEDGEIQNFKDGAFRIAVDCDADVIPVVIDGTFDILPKKRSTIDFGSQVTVCILPPVSVNDFDRSSGLMRKYVHELMKEKLAEIRSLKASGRAITSDIIKVDSVKEISSKN